MKRKLTPQDIINQYNEKGGICRDSLLYGDYKRGNSAGEKLIKIFKKLENNLGLAKLSLPILFENENPVTRTKAAAHCISLNIYIDEAEKVLETLAKEEDDIFGFNAEMTLKVWRDQGYLKMYPTQKINKDAEEEGGSREQEY